MNAVVTVSPALRAKAVDNLSKAKVQLVIHQPFFASVVCRRDIVIDDKVPTAYCTPRGKIVLGTAFFAGFTVAECVFILAHESMHYALMHHMRCGWRDKRRANVAMDKVINDILKEANVGTPVKEGVYLDGASQYAWEQLYDDEENKDDGKGPQGPYTPGQGNDDLGQDDGAGEELSPEEVEGIKRELLQARNAAKSVGKMPVSMDGLIEKMIKPITPWHQLTERFMLLQIKTGVSWRRPNKRFVGQDIYLPSYDIQPRMGTVVIQMDESGSIGDKELQHFSGHINSIIEVCRPERVIVLHTSTEVAHVEEFTAEDYPIDFKSHTTGGTDMTAGFDWVKEHGEEPDVFITLTDGYTPFGEAPGYPVLWLITTDVIAEHGETIPYQITEE